MAGYLFRFYITRSFRDNYVFASCEPFLGPFCWNKRINMPINRLAMEEYAVPSPTLKGSPGGDGNRFAGAVANPHHDLQPK